MNDNYSVEEILGAIEDLQKIKNEKKLTSDKSVSKVDNSNIPKNTLKLIEEAEKNKN